MNSAIPTPEDLLAEQWPVVRHVFEHCPMGINLLTLEKPYRVIWMNSRLEDMLGYGSEELKGVSFVEFTHPDDRLRNLRDLEAFRHNENLKYEVEKRYIRKDGSDFWARSHLSQFTDNQGRPICMVTTITGINKEKELAREARQLRSAAFKQQNELKSGPSNQTGKNLDFTRKIVDHLFDNSGISIWTYDCATRNFRIDNNFANKFNLHLDDSGYISLEKLSSLIHLEDRARVMSNIQKMIDGTIDRLRESYRTIDMDNNVVWLHSTAETGELDENGRPAQLFGTTRVAGQQAEHDEALRVSKERLELALQGSDLGVWDWDILADQIVYNNRWLEMLGYSPGEIGTSLDGWKSLVHPEDLKPVMHELNKHLQGRTPIYETEHRLRHKNGSWVWILDRGKVMRWNEEGKPARALGIHQDITEWKNSQLYLQRSEEQLRQANSELKSFAYTVSHDLKSPIRHILGFTDFLQNAIKENDEAKVEQYSANIRNAAGRLEKTINAILRLSRVSNHDLELEKVDITALANAVSGKLRNDYPDRSVRVTIEENLTAFADAELIFLLLENLLSNAWKYTAGNEQAAISLRTEKFGGETVFTISDNGIGFDAKEAESLFVPFARTESAEKFEGTGIGLATARRIVSLHRGRIWAKGKPGEGATFYFTLNDPT